MICLGGLVLLVVGTVAFAQVNTPAVDAKLTDADFLNELIKLFSWIWIMLAMIAGKLMTNTFVYGEFLNFDIYLWHMRNISKIFANLTLAFFFLNYVREVSFKLSPYTGSEIGKQVGGFLLAGVLIQMSWFLVGAVMDVEKITTSAIGSLPALVIQQDNSRGKYIIDGMVESNVLGRRFSLNKDTTQPLEPLVLDTKKSFVVDTSTDAGQSTVLDGILPSYNSISGPLYFIGFAIFKFQDYPKVSPNSQNNIHDITQLLTADGIKIIVQLAFIIFMLLLVIVNVIRVGYLWFVIALTPVIILYLVMKDVLNTNLLKSNEDVFGVTFDLPTIFAYIFQPTIIVAYMSLSLIAIVALWHGFDTTSITAHDYQGLVITNSGVTHQAFEFSSQWDMFDSASNQGKWIFKNLIMIWLIFSLLFGMIILSAKSLKMKVIENIAGKLWPAMLSLPFIPMMARMKVGKNMFEKATGITLWSAGSGMAKMDMKWDQAVRALVGLGGSWTSVNSYINTLNSNVNNPTKFSETVRAMRNERWAKGLSFNNTDNKEWRDTFIKFINEWKSVAAWFTPNKNDDDKPTPLTVGGLKDYLNNPNNKKALYTMMYGDKIPQTLPTGDILDEKFRPEEKPAESATKLIAE